MTELVTSGSVGGMVSNDCLYPDRVKLNSDPWNWKGSCERGYCYPAGEGKASPKSCQVRLAILPVANLRAYPIGCVRSQV